MAEKSSVACAAGAVAVTPSDTTAVNCRALYIGGTGDVVVETARGASVTFASVPAGFILPVQCNKVKAATTATSIVALL